MALIWGDLSVGVELSMALFSVFCFLSVLILEFGTGGDLGCSCAGLGVHGHDGACVCPQLCLTGSLMWGVSVGCEKAWLWGLL